ncbi:CAP domain-containing protein [Actinoplanes derwentensis]|uniref:Uncharacterized conserved protein YkwD, contains CAP (CSP/antigen 5/PR1) domain n=1 Tax=Actinoplanes derwentensis TaxID=113562 RepID=A0A1H1SWA3_9ACTN|nr:CAP domain-containing protein [Actinoplanes derwentensis]SDS52103.1 Uncharacterized conserved protein YkwD, contains CAP (CSP/antigen 5/PR1) domain [Actinoplanes derwentensis]
MRQILRRLAVTALLAPVAALGAATMTANPANAAKASAQALETQVNKLVNAERVKHGCSSLKVNTQITKAARAHSAYMAQTGKFSHTGKNNSRFSTRIKNAGYTKPSAENIAWGYQTASAVVDGWMKSPGHRTNILNCKSKTTGIGIARAANGAPYYTQDFGY